MRHELLFSGTLSDAKPYFNVQKQTSGAGTDLTQGVKPNIQYLNNVDGSDYSYGVWVNSVGRQKVCPDMAYPPKDHPNGYFFNVRNGRVLNEYQLVYITDGNGDFFEDKNKEGIKVKGGTLFWIVPGQWHSYCPSSKTGWSEYYIGFQGEVIKRLIGHSFLDGQSKLLEIGFCEELVSLFMRALEVARNRNAFTQQYLSGIVLHMIGLVMSQLQSIEEPLVCDINEQKIEQAKIVMKENVYVDLDLRELAASLNISYSWFRKLFKDYTGCSPAKYMQNQKIEKVKELLVTTNLSVKELLYILNYNTTENFYCAFKKYTGYTPTEYRHLLKEERTIV